MAQTDQPAPAATKDPYLLASLHRGLEVLDCFGSRNSWSLAELATHLLGRRCGELPLNGESLHVQGHAQSARNVWLQV